MVLLLQAETVLQEEREAPKPGCLHISLESWVPQPPPAILPPALRFPLVLVNYKAIRKNPGGHIDGCSWGTHDGAAVKSLAWVPLACFG